MNLKTRMPTPHWLVVELPTPWQTLGWPVVGPWRGQADLIAWHHLSNEELGPEVDAIELTRQRLAKSGLSGATCMLTSASLQRAQFACCGSVSVIATVGLSNAQRVDLASERSQSGWGTINVMVAVDSPLCEAAAVELISIAAQARTAAVMECGAVLPEGQVPTGTGTDCLVLAWPSVGEVRWAGLHTEVGQSVGSAVYRAVAAGAAGWLNVVSSRATSPLYPHRPTRQEDAP